MFHPVRVPEDRHRYGNPDSYAPSLVKVLPWGVLDIFDVFRGITHEKEHVDQDSHPILDQTLALIHRIDTYYTSQRLIEENLLSELHSCLIEIERENEPIKIFYPHIYARKATASYQKQKEEEEGRIQEAKEQASKTAQEYKNEAIRLLNLVNEKVHPGLGPEDSAVINALRAFKTLCDNAAEEQKGLVAKVISVVSKKMMTTIDQMRATYLGNKGEKGERANVVASNHPLVELLGILTDKTFTSEIHRRAKIKDALPRLEQYDKSFEGVQKFVRERISTPQEDPIRLRRVLHQFLMLRYIPKVNPEHYLDHAYLHVYKIACRLIDHPLPLQTSEQTELEWMIPSLNSPDPLTVHAIALVKADLEHEKALMALYNKVQGGNLSLRERPPELAASDADKIAWARAHQGNRAITEAFPTETRAATQTKSARFEGGHANAITYSPRIEEKVAWAKNHLRAFWGKQFMQNRPRELDDQDLQETVSLVRALEEQSSVRQDQLRSILTLARDLGAAPPNRDQEKWLKNLDLSPYRSNRDFIRRIKRFRGEIKTPDVINRDLHDFYVQANGAGLAEYPPPETEIGHKIYWAKRVIDGEIPCGDERLAALANEIREDLTDQFTLMLIYVHGNLRRDSTLPKGIEEIHRDLLEFYTLAYNSDYQIQEPEGKIQWAIQQIQDGTYQENVPLRAFAERIKQDIENPFLKDRIDRNGNLNCDPVVPRISWAQNQFGNCFMALFQPGDPSATKGAELLWMATAHYQQLQELDRIRIQVTRKEESPSIKAILKNLNLVIKALEMQPDLIGIDQMQALTRELVEPILDWITISHEFCRGEKQNAIQQKEVDELFKPIELAIREKNYLDAFKQLKNLLEKSPLATQKLIEDSNRNHLDQLENAFNRFLRESPPQETSQAQKEILHALGMDHGAPLTEQVLSKGVELQRKKMISNVLVLAGYKLLELIFGRLGQSYKKYREAVDTIAGKDEDYNERRVQGAITALLEESGYSLDSDEGKELVARLKASIQTTTRRFEGRLETDEAKQDLHQKTYQGLLSVLIAVNAKEHVLESHVARGLLPLLLWVIDLFVTPFSHTLIQRFTEDVILESNGQLTDLHVKPLEGLNDGLSTYNDRVAVWPDIARRKAAHDPVASEYRNVTGGEQQKDLAQMLNTSWTYPHGLTSSQIDQKGLYMCVDEYLHVAHLCQDVQGVFDQITEKLWKRSHPHPIVNGLAFGVKGAFSLLPYTYAWGYFLILRTSELLINFSLQQIAKFAIWYTQAGTNFMMQTLNATVKSSGYTTALDKILLEKLKDLERDLEKEAKLANKEERGAVSVNDKSLRALLSHLKTTLGTIQCDTADDVRALEAALPPGLKALEAFATTQIKDATVPLIIRTFESFLHQESMLLALYRGLELVNKGVREESDPLTEEQIDELVKEEFLESREEITEDHISGKIAKIHDGLKKEMAKTLKKILETAAHPMIDRAIDELAKYPGQVVSETISWLEKTLYDVSGNGESECILRKLKQNFERLEGADRNIALNNMYEDYSHFIKVFREHEDDLKRHQSYNGILLTNNVLNKIAEPLKKLTLTLAEAMKSPSNNENRVALGLALKAVEEAVTRNIPRLNEVKESETTSHAERHQGMMGRTLGSWEVFLSSLKEKAKAPVHQGLDQVVGLLAENGRKIPRNPVLMQHLARSVIAPYLKV